MKIRLKTGGNPRYCTLVTGLILVLSLGGAAMAAAADPEPGAESAFADITFVWCPSGKYYQGSDYVVKLPDSLAGAKAEWYADEYPRHQVEILTGFWMSKHEITRKQWLAVMKTEPWKNFSEATDENLPATGVNWSDCQEFIKKLNPKVEGKLRLPKEADWEYACRAGSDSIFYFGDDVAQLSQYAWFRNNAQKSKVCPVGQKKPNAWGLCDMLGNAWEWCEDAYAPYEAKTARTAPKTRVVRGGSVNSTAGFLHCAFRMGTQPDRSTPQLGFRLVREP